MRPVSISGYKAHPSSQQQASSSMDRCGPIVLFDASATQRTDSQFNGPSVLREASASSSAALPSAAAMQAAALPSAAAIRVGEIVIGRATQYNSGSALRSADGGVHKYLHHLVTGVKPDGALPRAAPARAVDDQDFAAALRKRQTLSLT